MDMKDFHQLLRNPLDFPTWGLVSGIDPPLFPSDGSDVTLIAGMCMNKPTVLAGGVADFPGDPSRGHLPNDTYHSIMLVYDSGQWFGDIDDANGMRGPDFKRAREITDAVCSPTDVPIEVLQSILAVGYVATAASIMRGDFDPHASLDERLQKTS